MKKTGVFMSRIIFLSFVLALRAALLASGASDGLRPLVQQVALDVSVNTNPVAALEIVAAQLPFPLNMEIYDIEEGAPSLRRDVTLSIAGLSIRVQDALSELQRKVPGMSWREYRDSVAVSVGSIPNEAASLLEGVVQRDKRMSVTPVEFIAWLAEEFPGLRIAFRSRDPMDEVERIDLSVSRGMTVRDVLTAFVEHSQRRWVARITNAKPSPFDKEAVAGASFDVHIVFVRSGLKPPTVHPSAE